MPHRNHGIKARGERSTRLRLPSVLASAVFCANFSFGLCQAVARNVYRTFIATNICTIRMYGRLEEGRPMTNRKRSKEMMWSIQWEFFISSYVEVAWSLEMSRLYVTRGGPRWRSWLRHCATSQKVVGSIPDGVIGIFHWHKSFWPHYGPGEYFLGVKSGRCVGLTTLPPSCADCLEIWEPQPPGTLWACSGL